MDAENENERRMSTFKPALPIASKLFIVKTQPYHMCLLTR
jgi:hypothetical protein